MLKVLILWSRYARGRWTAFLCCCFSRKYGTTPEASPCWAWATSWFLAFCSPSRTDSMYRWVWWSISRVFRRHREEEGCWNEVRRQGQVINLFDCVSLNCSKWRRRKCDSQTDGRVDKISVFDHSANSVHILISSCFSGNRKKKSRFARSVPPMLAPSPRGSK